MRDPNYKDEYIEVSRPDKEQLAEYLKQAKGENRTMAEFAKVCKLASASTFSRIMNKKITKSLPAKLIEAIVENAENPENISLEAVMRANGMMLQSEWEREGYRRRSEERRSTNEAIKRIIVNELYARGCMLRVYPSLPYEEFAESKFFLHWQSNMAVTVQGYEPKFWNFLIYVSYPDRYGYVNENRRYGHIMSDMIEHRHVIFLRDMWEPEAFKDVKHTFVFAEEELYNIFSDFAMRIKVNNDMSVLLIDTARHRVVEEKMIPRHGQNTQKTDTSIFELKREFFFD